MARLMAGRHKVCTVSEAHSPILSLWQLSEQQQHECSAESKSCCAESQEVAAKHGHRALLRVIQQQPFRGEQILHAIACGISGLAQRARRSSFR